METYLEEQTVSSYHDFSLAQKKVIVIIPKVTAVLSLWGSFYIIYDIFRSYRGDRDDTTNVKVYHRILLALSISDCVLSFSSYFMNSWLIPKDIKEGDYFWGHIGTRETCMAQGFLTQLGSICSLLYTALLSIYFLLFIKYKWEEHQFRKIEPFVHGSILIYAIISATVPLLKNLYNPEISFCWIQSYPYKCDTDENIECIYGEDILMYRIIFFILPSSCAFTTITICMTTLCIHTHNQIKRIRRFSRSLSVESEENYRQNCSVRKLVFKKAVKYILAFIVVWFPSIIFALSFSDNTSYVFIIYTIAVVTGPLQGYWNALIYANVGPYEFLLKSLEIFRCDKSSRLGSCLKNDPELETQEKEITPTESLQA